MLPGLLWTLLFWACGAPGPLSDTAAGPPAPADPDDAEVGAPAGAGPGAWAAAAPGEPVGRRSCGNTSPSARWDPQPVGAHALDEGGEYLDSDGLSGATVDIGPIFVELHARLLDADGDLGRGRVRLWLDREIDGVVDTSAFPTVVRPIVAEGGPCGLAAAALPVECTLEGSGGLEDLGDCHLSPEVDYEAALQVVDVTGRASPVVITRFRAPGLHG